MVLSFRKYFGHSLIGLRDGSLLKLGGIEVFDDNRPYENAATPEIFKLTTDADWIQMGDLQKVKRINLKFHKNNFKISRLCRLDHLSTLKKFQVSIFSPEKEIQCTESRSSVLI